MNILKTYKMPLHCPTTKRRILGGIWKVSATAPNETTRVSLFMAV